MYAATTPPPAPAQYGSWRLTIDFPTIPVSTALEVTTGRLIVWSAYSPSQFTGTNGQQTVTAVYDPAKQLVSSPIITNTGHDMFCEGLSMDPNGRMISTGGNSGTLHIIANSYGVGDCEIHFSRIRSFTFVP